MTDSFDLTALGRAIADFQARKDEWARLPVGRKIAYLQQLHANTGVIAGRWAAAPQAAILHDSCPI